MLEDIPRVSQLPKNISFFFEQNKGVEEKYAWLTGLLQSFEQVSAYLARISLSEYKARFVDKYPESASALSIEKDINQWKSRKPFNPTFGIVNQLTEKLAKCFSEKNERTKNFVSSIWSDSQSSPEAWIIYNNFYQGVLSSLSKVKSPNLNFSKIYRDAKEAYQNFPEDQEKVDLHKFLRIICETRNKTAHANEAGRFWPITPEYLDICVPLLKQCFEALTDELSPLWKYKTGHIKEISQSSLIIKTEEDTEIKFNKPKVNLSLSLKDEILFDPLTKEILANLELKKNLFLSQALEKKVWLAEKAKDKKSFKKVIQEKLEDDNLIDLSEKKELEALAKHNLGIEKEELRELILEVSKDRGISNPFAKFDPAFVEILDHAIKSGDIDEMVLGLQSKTYGLEFGDFKKLLRERILKLGFNPTQFSTVERLNVLSQELTDARCITEACCWLRDLKRLNAEKGGLYISESTMCKGYETRTGKHQRIFDEIRQILSDRIDRLSGSESWQTKVNTKWRSNMPSYLSCHSYNTQLKVGYKRKLAGGELHLLLWAGHHDKDPSIPLSRESDWSFLRIGVGYTKELMPGGRKYNPNNFDYALYERIVSEITKETIREYYDAFVSHPDLYLFNHSLTNSLTSRDEMVPVSELDPKSEKLDYYFRHNPGLKTLCFVNQWPLLKKNPVKVLRNLDASFLLLSEMLNEIERNYEISIRATNSDSETKSGIRSNRGSGFHGITSTLRECLNETKKQLPKKLRNKVKEDHPKSGKGSRFVDSISLNKQDVDRGLVELVYGFWQGENKGEILCGFDARTALRSRPLSEEESNPSEDILYQFFQSFNGSEQPTGKGGTKRKVDTPNYFYQPNHLSFRTTLKRNEKTDYKQTDIQENWEETKVEITKLLGFSDGKFVKLF